MNYRPGTIDDAQVARTRGLRQRKRVRQATTSSGSQIYQTTSKVGRETTAIAQANAAISALETRFEQLAQAMSSTGSLTHQEATGPAAALTMEWQDLLAIDVQPAEGLESTLLTITAHGILPYHGTGILQTRLLADTTVIAATLSPSTADGTGLALTGLHHLDQTTPITIRLQAKSTTPSAYPDDTTASLALSVSADHRKKA